MKFFLMRNPAIAMTARADSCYFLRPGESPVAMAGVDVQAISRAMQISAAPVTQEEVDDILGAERRAFLVDRKVLLHAPKPVLEKILPAAREIPRPVKHLVLGITGAIASLQVVPLVLELLSHVAEKVDVILTDAALNLVKPEAIEYLGARAWTDTFSLKGDMNVPHVQLAQAADLVVVLPASAHTLHKIAQGACSDLLSLTVAATSAPVVLFPSMNCAMWDNPGVGRNIRQLREDGFYVVEPGAGREVAQGTGQMLMHGAVGLGQVGLVQFLREIVSLHKETLQSAASDPDR